MYFRVLLNLHEFFMVSRMIQCGDRFCPPAWFLCSISFNHLLLVINSSVNILVYCSVGEKFRWGFRARWTNGQQFLQRNWTKIKWQDAKRRKKEKKKVRLIFFFLYVCRQGLSERLHLRQLNASRKRAWNQIRETLCPKSSGEDPSSGSVPLSCRRGLRTRQDHVASKVSANQPLLPEVCPHKQQLEPRRVWKN